MQELEALANSPRYRVTIASRMIAGRNDESGVFDRSVQICPSGAQYRKEFWWPPKFSPGTPMLTVSHAAAAIDFYTNALDVKQLSWDGAWPMASSTAPPSGSTERR
jgi:hypothetical protein